MHHDLNMVPDRYEELELGIRHHDIRFNDRGFRDWDTVTYREGQSEVTGFMYTGREKSARIRCVDTYGVDEGYVSFSLVDIGMLIV